MERSRSRVGVKFCDSGADHLDYRCDPNRSAKLWANDSSPSCSSKRKCWGEHGPYLFFDLDDAANLEWAGLCSSCPRQAYVSSAADYDRLKRRSTAQHK